MTVLERNLARLLREAYQPVLPRESFREGLRRDFLARAGRFSAPSAAPPSERTPTAPTRDPDLVLGDPRRRPNLRLVPGLLAAAAAAVLALWLGPRLLSGLDQQPSFEAILARGEVAVRTSPDQGWRGAGSTPLRWSGDPLEIATPSDGAEATGVDVLAGTARLELEPASRAALRAAGNGAASLELSAGAVSVEGELAVTTAEGDLRFAGGAARLAYAGEGPERALRIEAPLGRVFAGDADRQLAPGATALLRDGGLLDADGAGPSGAALVAVDGGSEGRKAMAEAEPAGTDAGDGGDGGEGLDGDFPPAQLVGRAWLPPATADEEGEGDAERLADLPAESFRVLLLEQVALPMVAEPLVFDFDQSGGAFRIDGVKPGRYAVFARAAGCALWRGDLLNLSAEVEQTLEVRFEPGCSVAGLVLDEVTGLPIGGARVVSETDAALQILSLSGSEFDDRPGVLPMTRTASDGSFVLEDLSSRVHVLRASAPGHAPAWVGPVAVSAPGAPADTVAPAEFELGGGGRLEGQVRDGAGAGVDGAMLILSVTEFGSTERVMSYGQVLTDATGRFVLEHLPEGHWPLLHFGPVEAIEAEREGGPAPEPELAFVRIEEGETTVKDFAPPVDGVRFTGQLLNPDGTPASGRAIWVTPTVSSGSEMVSTNADAEGRFALDGLVPQRYALFTSRGSPPDMVMLEAIDVSSGGDLLDHTVRLQSGGVSGRVLDGVGKQPMARTVILLLGRSGEETFVGKTFSDADGRFEFEFVSAGRYEVQVVSARPAWGQARVEGVELGRGQRFDLGELFLYPGGGLRLLATDPAGAPVRGAFVDLIYEDGVRYDLTDRVATDSDGVYTIEGLSAGRWTVELNAPGFETHRTSFEVARSETATEVRVELEPRR